MSTLRTVLYYCSALFSLLGLAALDCSQAKQNAADGLLTRSNGQSHITPLLISLYGLSVEYRIQFKILTLTYSGFVWPGSHTCG